MFDEIAKVFDVRGKPVLFAWGDIIFAPSGVSSVSPQLIAHEGVHGKRQKSFSYTKLFIRGEPEPIDLDADREQSIAGWWKMYLSDPEFRLEEEKLGHRAEYLALCAALPSRSDRRRHLSHVAGRLASPLYRYSITKEQAKTYLGAV